MISRRVLAILAARAALAALLIGSIAAPAAAAGPATRPKTGNLTPRLAALASPALRSASQERQGTALSLPAHGAGSLLRRGDRVVVDVKFISGAASHVRDLRSAGARILVVSSRYQTITAAVAPASLRAVARVPGVHSVVEVLTPMVAGTGPRQPAVVNSVCPAGSVVSEGDTQLHAA